MERKDEIENCLISLSRTDSTMGKIELPNHLFGIIGNANRFFAFQREDSPYIHLLPIDKDAYEIYAEVKYGKLSPLIRKITRMSKGDCEIQFLPELAGTCPPEEKGESCIFQGFVFTNGGMEKMKDIKRTLSDIEDENGDKIVVDMEVTAIQ